MIGQGWTHANDRVRRKHAKKHDRAKTRTNDVISENMQMLYIIWYGENMQNDIGTCKRHACPAGGRARAKSQATSHDPPQKQQRTVAKNIETPPHDRTQKRRKVATKNLTTPHYSPQKQRKAVDTTQLHHTPHDPRTQNKRTNRNLPSYPVPVYIYPPYMHDDI